MIMLRYTLRTEILSKGFILKSDSANHSFKKYYTVPSDHRPCFPKLEPVCHVTTLLIQQHLFSIYF